VLGETILSSSIAFQAVVNERSADATVVLTAIGALLTVFSMWWIYFAKPAAEALVSNRVGFVWGYVHFVVFASAAAVGAGVAVVVDSVTHHAHISDTGAAASFTIPVVLYVAVVAFIEALTHGLPRARVIAFAVALVLVAVATFTAQPVFVTGIVLAALVATNVAITARATATAR